MTITDPGLESALTELEAVVEAQDIQRLPDAMTALQAALRSSADEQAAAVGPRVAGFVSRLPRWQAAYVAVFAGACVERGADATLCAAPVLDGLGLALEGALDFAQRWAQVAGQDEDFPDPRGERLTDELLARVGDPQDPDTFRACAGWWTVHEWERAAVAMLSSAAVRARVAQRRELLALIDRLHRIEGLDGEFRCVQTALLVLDDELVLVLHRASGKAFRVRISGIADNYQFQTLLADALIGGGHVPGQAPSARSVAISRDADFEVSAVPHESEQFNLAGPSGAWVWSADTPACIPTVDGIRTVVLDPPVYRHLYRVVRFIPRLHASLRLEEVIEATQAEHLFRDVQPLHDHTRAGLLTEREKAAQPTL